MTELEKVEDKKLLDDFNPDSAEASDNQLTYDLQTETLTEKKITEIDWTQVDQDKPFNNGDEEHRKRLQDEEIEEIKFSRDLKSFFKWLVVGASIGIAGVYIIDTILVYFDKVPVSDKITTIMQYVLTTSIGFLIGNGTKKE